MLVDWKKAQKKSAHTARSSMTMAKVRISQALARTCWQLVTFVGPAGAESVGIVDLIAIRKAAFIGAPQKPGTFVNIL